MKIFVLILQSCYSYKNWKNEIDSKCSEPTRENQFNCLKSMLCAFKTLDVKNRNPYDEKCEKMLKCCTKILEKVKRNRSEIIKNLCLRILFKQSPTMLEDSRKTLSV